MDVDLREAHHLEIKRAGLELEPAWQQKQKAEPSVLVRARRLGLAPTPLGEVDNHARDNCPGGVQRNASHSPGRGRLAEDGTCQPPANGKHSKPGPAKKGSQEEPRIRPN